MLLAMTTEDQIRVAWSDLLTSHRELTAIYLAALGSPPSAALEGLLTHMSECVELAWLALPLPE